MANTVKLKRSAVARKVPGAADLQLGEIALNTTDGRLFSKKNDGVTDSVVEFLSTDFAFKTSVVAATTANITLLGTQTIDGVSVVAGDRVLVKNQSSASGNGIYIVNGSNWTRATDADTAAELAGAIIPVSRGAANAGKVYRCTFLATQSLGTDAVSISEFGAATGGGGGNATVTQSLSTSPPSSPSAGNLWWQTDTGSLKIYYDDGNSSQWVDASSGAAGPAGTNGTNGTNGTDGAAATITLGSTTTVNPATSPSVTNSGTSSAAVFNFSLPRAAALNLGSTTVLNPNQNPTVGSATSNGDVTYSFSLPRASAVSVGTVTTGAAGSSASITNVGTNGDVVLNFTIPKGDAGTNGTNGTNGATGPQGPMGPKTVALQYPTTADTKVVAFYTTSALTLSKLIAVLPGGTTTPSVSYNVRYGSDVSAAGTAVTASANTVTSVSTGTAVTSFSNASISAGSFVWVEITAVSGTVPNFSLTMEFV